MYGGSNLYIMAITCSECGAGFDRLEVREDKDKTVGYAAGKPIYAKMYICKDCTNQWTEGEE